MNRSRWIVGYVAIGLLVLSTWSPTLAQDLIIEEDQALIPAVPNAFVVQEASFDQWVFGTLGRQALARQKLESVLLMNVAELDRACQLTGPQKAKLTLAGQGDIKHLFNRVAEVHRTYEQLKHDQAQVNTIFQETQPLAARLKMGLFGTDSIFTRTIESTLDSKQVEVYRKTLDERARYRHRASVALMVANLDQGIGLNADQRRRLNDLVFQETRPSSKSAGQYEVNVMLLKVARIPEPKLRPLFDEPSWKLFQERIQGADAMKAFLKANGFLEESDLDLNQKSANPRIQ